MAGIQSRRGIFLAAMIATQVHALGVAVILVGHPDRIAWLMTIESGIATLAFWCRWLYLRLAAPTDAR